MSIFLINRFSFVSSSIEVSELPPSGHFPVCDSTSSLGSSLQYSIVPDLRDVEWIFFGSQNCIFIPLRSTRYQSRHPTSRRDKREINIRRNRLIAARPVNLAAESDFLLSSWDLECFRQSYLKREVKMCVCVVLRG